jgi:hypothetical protein
VQVSEEEATTVTGLHISFGYHYHDVRTGQPWIEFHVDYRSRCVPNISNDEETSAPNKEATMSIRVSPRAKLLMIIAQDESVFAQYLLGSKTWVGPKGQRPLLPKSEEVDTCYLHLYQEN